MNSRWIKIKQRRVFHKIWRIQPKTKIIWGWWGCKPINTNTAMMSFIHISPVRLRCQDRTNNPNSLAWKRKLAGHLDQWHIRAVDPTCAAAANITHLIVAHCAKQTISSMFREQRDIIQHIEWIKHVIWASLARKTQQYSPSSTAVRNDMCRWKLWAMRAFLPFFQQHQKQ